ncbi:phosphopantetheine-binding protein [Thiohalophilus thiocyanatoxydans]|uniref:Acyl carrier protein n=1 Tax=Thiohalophilus thiocyanatoxydans TaxID=381308 RepID=A0A4R8IPQ5_9GAMM|nr:phosphopantetheine-binding protein [Thiohalophilus thiocyanatoxydans]TDY02921.1 acyl carrier protein [Thiohalophilus thiocyanatoxydans]
MTNFENEIAGLIIESLNLEDIEVDDIDPEEPLFNEGLGLDSIDALELSVALSRKYGINLRADNPDIQKIFSSLRMLTSYVESNATIGK